MTIDWRVIPHSEQRYPTVGDWWFENSTTWHIRVSDLGNFQFEALVFLHELVEMLLCVHGGIGADQIDHFDINYESARTFGQKAPCGCPALHDEPGDDPHAPYHRQHQAAELCEFVAAKLLGVNWKEYCKKIDELS